MRTTILVIMLFTATVAWGEGITQNHRDTEQTSELIVLAKDSGDSSELNWVTHDNVHLNRYG